MSVNTELNSLTLLGPGAAPGGQTILLGDQTQPGQYDDLIADPNTTAIYGYGGDDILTGFAGKAGYVQDIQLYGGPGHDILYGEYFYTSEYYSLGPTEFENQYGRIKPGPGALAYGEAGQDTLLGSLKDDTLDGGDDPDYLQGYLGDDILTGGPGNDIVNGDQSQDDVEGNDGIDLIGGGGGSDHLKGGLEADRIYGDSRYHPPYGAWDGYNYTLAQGINGLIEVIPIVQDAPEDEAGDDVLEGHEGQDLLYGGAGNDLLDGGTEADDLQGEGGDDILFGADGDDRLWGDSSSDAVTTDAQPIPGDFGTYTYYWRERHVGPDRNDYLDGGAGDDQRWGRGGSSGGQHGQRLALWRPLQWQRERRRHS